MISNSILIFLYFFLWCPQLERALSVTVSPCNGIYVMWFVRELVLLPESSYVMRGATLWVSSPRANDTGTEGNNSYGPGHCGVSL